MRFAYCACAVIITALCCVVIYKAGFSCGQSYERTHHRCRVVFVVKLK